MFPSKLPGLLPVAALAALLASGPAQAQTTLKLIPPNVSSFAMVVTSLSMVLIPAMAVLARRIRPMVSTPAAPAPGAAPGGSACRSVRPG